MAFFRGCFVLFLFSLLVYSEPIQVKFEKSEVTEVVLKTPEVGASNSKIILKFDIGPKDKIENATYSYCIQQGASIEDLKLFKYCAANEINSSWPEPVNGESISLSFPYSFFRGSQGLENFNPIYFSFYQVTNETLSASVELESTSESSEEYTRLNNTFSNQTIEANTKFSFNVTEIEMYKFEVGLSPASKKGIESTKITLKGWNDFIPKSEEIEAFWDMKIEFELNSTDPSKTFSSPLNLVGRWYWIVDASSEFLLSLSHSNLDFKILALEEDKILTTKVTKTEYTYISWYGLPQFAVSPFNANLNSGVKFSLFFSENEIAYDSSHLENMDTTLSSEFYAHLKDDSESSKYANFSFLVLPYIGFNQSITSLLSISKTKSTYYASIILHNDSSVPDSYELSLWRTERDICPLCKNSGNCNKDEKSSSFATCTCKAGSSGVDCSILKSDLLVQVIIISILAGILLITAVVGLTAWSISKKKDPAGKVRELASKLQCRH